MCNLGVELALSAIGTVLNVASSIQDANAKRNQYEYEAQVAKNNAKIAQQNADQKRQEGIEEARLSRMKTLQKAGSQKAAIAASNFDAESGTALDTFNDISTMGELDALNKRYESEKDALAYEQQANNYMNQANLDTFYQKNAASPLNTINTAVHGLGGTTSVARRWYNSTKNFKKKTTI